MAGEDHRVVTLQRVDEGVYRARNARGGELVFGSRAGDAFKPVELLLAALAGCSAVDADVATGRRSPAETFELTAEADVVTDAAGGQLMQDIRLTVHITFPPGPAGDAARDVLPRAVRVSHEKTCTVSRTLEAAVPVTVQID